MLNVYVFKCARIRERETETERTKDTEGERTKDTEGERRKVTEGERARGTEGERTIGMERNDRAVIVSVPYMGVYSGMGGMEWNTFVFVCLCVCVFVSV